MKSGLVAFGGEIYYFGGAQDGAMKTGAQTIADAYGEGYKFYFGTEDDELKGYQRGVAVTGAKNGYLYVNGKLEVADNGYKFDVVNVDTNNDGDLDATFIINTKGRIMTSDDDYTDDGYTIADASDCTFVTTGATVRKGSIVSGDLVVEGVTRTYANGYYN